MKARPFIIGLIITIIALILISLGLWQATSFKSPLNIHNDEIGIPQAARFFPKSNYLTIHLNLDLDNLPKYIEASVPEKERKNAKKEGAKLRDGIFAIIGLDYEKDILNRFDSRVSFSIFNPIEDGRINRWILVLKSNNKKDDSYLKDFWERKAFAGTEVVEEVYEDINIKYIRGNLLSENKKNIATAVAGQNEFLIASDIDTLKESLEIYLNSQESQFNNEKLIQSISKINTGISLVTISKQALISWFNLPLTIGNRNDFEELISSIKVDKSNIIINGIFSFNDKVFFIKDHNNENNNLLNELGLDTSIEDVAMLNEPSLLLSNSSKDPISQLIGPSINEYLDKPDLNKAKIISKLENGEMIFARGSEGWIIGTTKNSQKENVINLLKEHNYYQERIPTETADVEVWSRIRLNKLNKHENLIKEIAFILDEEGERNWWSNQLFLLQKRKKGITIYPEQKIFLIPNEKSWDSINQKISLGKVSSSQQLEKWKPWMLMEKIIGKSLENNIKSLDLVLGSNQNENNSELNFLAKLSLN